MNFNRETGAEVESIGWQGRGPEWEVYQNHAECYWEDLLIANVEARNKFWLYIKILFKHRQIKKTYAPFEHNSI